MRLLICVLIVSSMSSCSYDRIMANAQSRRIKASPLEQVNLEEMVERYMAKDQSSIGTIEGIYSVSSVVTKKGKAVFSAREKERITDRRENYSKVAIIRDHSEAGREYIEIVIDKGYKGYTSSYPVYGEFSAMAESNLLLYKHYDSRARSTSYTFTYDKSKDILEGVRTDNAGKNSTITYKLTYIKLSPKAQPLSAR